MALKVMIRCPETGEPVYAGLSMDIGSFESGFMPSNVLVNCPACGRDHVWSKEDAFLEEN